MKRTGALGAVTILMLALLGAVAAPAKEAKARNVAQTAFFAKEGGEALLDLTALAPSTDWSRKGAESAVATVTLDGKYSQDVVLFAGEERFTYPVALGPVERGRHTVEVAFSPEKSPEGASGAKVRGMRAEVVPEGSEAELVYRHSPILYGRDLPEIAGRYENNHTDVPLLMYHTLSREGRDTTIEYTVVWSNEDGGTNTPALMARWGRTTDIEWIYRVTLDGQNHVISEVYQGPNHQTLPFTGAKEGDHPLLQTATINNNLEQVEDPALSSGYRFFMDPAETLPEDRAREAVMDANPWTYPVMAGEIMREGKVEEPASPGTKEVSDQRNYLFAEFDKNTAYSTPPAPGSWVGTALAVKLEGDRRWYASHHNVPDWSIQRDIPAATTVELPPGTTAEDVEAVKAMAVSVGAERPENYRIVVTDINRAFFLGEDFMPGEPFIEWSGSVELVPERSEAVVWQRYRDARALRS